jgi:hypothetical protein
VSAAITYTGPRTSSPGAGLVVGHGRGQPGLGVLLLLIAEWGGGVTVTDVP